MSCHTCGAMVGHRLIPLPKLPQHGTGASYMCPEGQAPTQAAYTLVVKRMHQLEAELRVVDVTLEANGGWQRSQAVAKYLLRVAIEAEGDFTLHGADTARVLRDCADEIAEGKDLL